VLKVPECSSCYPFVTRFLYARTLYRFR